LEGSLLFLLVSERNKCKETNQTKLSTHSFDGEIQSHQNNVVIEKQFITQKMMTSKMLFFAFLALIGLSFMESQVNYLLSKSTAETEKMTYLALGDSYTIGESVAEKERWPVILADELNRKGIVIEKPKIIAKTGWRTDQLLETAKKEIGSIKYDFVSLLIGVNNEFQGRSVASFEPEFTACLDYAIQHCATGKSGVFVLSIPDYGFTPYGHSNRLKISKRIDAYNAICKRISEQKNVRYYDITELSRLGFIQPDLVANDGLHPSGKQYKLWVETHLNDLYNQLKP